MSKIVWYLRTCSSENICIFILVFYVSPLYQDYERKKSLHCFANFGKVTAQAFHYMGHIPR